jgi:hypothetical protein
VAYYYVKLPLTTSNGNTGPGPADYYVNLPIVSFFNGPVGNSNYYVRLPLIVAGIVFDPDAQAFISAAMITDSNQQIAINNLVISLKSAGLWSKMIAIYPFVGGNAFSHSFNLKDPRNLDAAFRLTFYGSPTHSATGVQPNGINQYAQTFLNDNLIPINNSHLSYYSRTNIVAIEVEMGAYLSSAGTYNLFNVLGSLYSANQSYESSIATSVPTLGFQITSKISTGQYKIIRNGITLTTVNSLNAAPTNLPFYLFCYNNNSSASIFSSKECAFSSIGKGFSDSESINFNFIVQTYQTALGRQV